MQNLPDSRRLNMVETVVQSCIRPQATSVPAEHTDILRPSLLLLLSSNAFSLSPAQVCSQSADTCSMSSNARALRLTASVISLTVCDCAQLADACNRDTEKIRNRGGKAGRGET